MNDRRVKKLQEAYTNIKHNADGTRLISNFVTPLRTERLKTTLKTKVIETSYQEENPKSVRFLRHIDRQVEKFSRTLYIDRLKRAAIEKT